MHTDRPPDWEGMIHILLFGGPLFVGLSMATSGADAISSVMATWLTNMAMFVALASHHRH